MRLLGAVDTGEFGDWSFWLGNFLGVVWLDPVSQRRCGSGKSPCNFRSGRIFFFTRVFHCIYRRVTPCKMDQVGIPKIHFGFVSRTRLFFSFISVSRGFLSFTHPLKQSLPLPHPTHTNPPSTTSPQLQFHPQSSEPCPNLRLHIPPSNFPIKIAYLLNLQMLHIASLGTVRLPTSFMLHTVHPPPSPYLSTSTFHSLNQSTLLYNHPEPTTSAHNLSRPNPLHTNHNHNHPPT